MPLGNAKQRVLQKLLEAKYKSVYWNGKVLPSGYVTNGILRRVDVGGGEAIRRKRELEAAGIAIDKQTFSAKNETGKNEFTFIYCLETDPQFIDFIKCCLKQ